MNNQAFSKIWIVVIVAVLLIGGILAWQYWWAPKEEVKAPEDETANWKIYQDEEYGYELKYPSDWYATPVHIAGYQIHFENASAEDIRKSGPPPEGYARIELQIKIGYSSINEWLNEFEEQAKIMEEAGLGKPSITKEEITIGGIKGYKVVVSSPEDGETPGEVIGYIGVFKNGKVYELSQLDPLECQIGNCKIFSQMFSAFKFKGN